MGLALQDCIEKDPRKEDKKTRGSKRQKKEQKQARKSPFEVAMESSEHKVKKEPDNSYSFEVRRKGHTG